MNDTEETPPTSEGATWVQVEVCGCPPGDAQTVFTALDTMFHTDRARDDEPRDPAGTGTIVWAASVDVFEAPAPAAPPRLTEPVTVSAQGGYWAVDRLLAGLASAFAVQDIGSVSGDQEREAELRLDNREG
ncbi:hypothetical protein [Streptomyces cucumeris]|uniref:hypothetical protein n=1 Tax=Streptomyces cucumeris TaxID=2962890 RepID=UPI003EC04448